MFAGLKCSFRRDGPMNRGARRNAAPRLRIEPLAPEAASTGRVSHFPFWAGSVAAGFAVAAGGEAGVGRVGTLDTVAAGGGAGAE